ncbi:MAG: response regulator [Legionellales bacterium]|nr:response regulator [Legionellales bacterium]
MPKILIIEDNKTTASYLAQGLKEHHYVTDVAHNDQDGLHMAENESYDLITLDVMLPVMDGWTVLQKIRQLMPDIPVLFLTAKDQVTPC